MDRLVLALALVLACSCASAGIQETTILVYDEYLHRTAQTEAAVAGLNALVGCDLNVFVIQVHDEKLPVTTPHTSGVIRIWFVSPEALAERAGGDTFYGYAWTAGPGTAKVLVDKTYHSPVRALMHELAHAFGAGHVDFTPNLMDRTASAPWFLFESTRRVLEKQCKNSM